MSKIKSKPTFKLVKTRAGEAAVVATVVSSTSHGCKLYVLNAYTLSSDMTVV